MAAGEGDELDANPDLWIREDPDRILLGPTEILVLDHSWEPMASTVRKISSDAWTDAASSGRMAAADAGGGRCSRSRTWDALAMASWRSSRSAKRSTTARRLPAGNGWTRRSSIRSCLGSLTGQPRTAFRRGPSLLVRSESAPATRRATSRLSTNEDRGTLL